MASGMAVRILRVASLRRSVPLRRSAPLRTSARSDTQGRSPLLSMLSLRPVERLSLALRFSIMFGTSSTTGITRLGRCK